MTGSSPLRYLWAIAACIATAAAATPLLPVVDLANIVLLFLLTVVLVAVRLGRGPAVAAAFASVALFDFFFVPPRFSWAVADAQYLITFVVMLAVALITGQLTARLRAQAEAAERREAETRALYEMATELAGAIAPGQVADSVRRFVSAELGAVATLYLPDAADALAPLPAGPVRDIAHVRAVYAEGRPMTLAAADSGYLPALLLPLASPMRTRGVLLVAAQEVGRIVAAEQRPLLEAVASLAAIAVERLHYGEVAQQATLAMESEKLRSALLSTVSHDLRTPLTVLVGLADSLQLVQPPLPAPAAETAAAIREQALRLYGLVRNLLDMARLQVGRVRLNREWQPLEEIVGASLSAVEPLLPGRPVHIELPPDLPLLAFDAVLIERVLCNLLENAAKYAPVGAIAISARRLGDTVEIAVADEGPGLPAGHEEAIFNLFERGRHEGTAAGVGLGLAICRVIVEAHGGRIRAENRAAGGARFAFTLPAGTPPAVEEEAGG